MGWQDEAIALDEQPEDRKPSWMAEAIPLDEQPARVNGGMTREQVERDIAMADERDELSALAKLALNNSYLPGVKAYAIEAGADIVSPIARMLGQGEYADRMNRFSSAVEQEQASREEGGIVPDILQRGIRGAGRSATTMVGAAMAAGPYGAIAAAMGQEANRAITEGRDAGLSGGKLVSHAVAQGVIEGVPAAVMQKIGLGGAESLAAGKQAIGAGVKGGLKTLGISIAQELPEELITEIGHNAVSKISGTDPNALSLDSLKQTVAETTVQTILTVGAVGVVPLSESYRLKKLEEIRSEITAAADEGRAPSRKEWKRWGLPESDGMSEAQRRAGVESLSAKIRESQEMAEAEAAPAEQEVQPNETNDTSEESPVEQQAPESAPPVTSIKNAMVDELREGRGDAVVSGVEPETQAQWLENAEKRIIDNPLAPSQLVDDIIAEPRNISDEDTAVLQLHYRKLNNDFAAAAEKITAASQSGDLAAKIGAQKQAEIILGQIQKTEAASKAAGREWGRAGVARQMEIKADYSLAGLTRRAIVSKGDPLTPDESAKIKELSDKIAELESRLEVRNTDKREQDSIKAVDKAINGFVPKKRFQKRVPSIKKIEAQRHVQDAWADFKSKLTGPAEGLLSGESGALNVDLLESGAKLVKAYADLGVATFSEFWSSAKANLGDVADSAKDTLRKAWESAQESGIIPKREIDATDPDDIAKEAKRIARSLVESGMRGRDEIVDAVHEELQKSAPEITRRQTMDAMSGYGKFSELSKDDVSTVIRDINGQLQQLSKLEDMSQGRAPEKTGVERRTPSDEERRLIQQVNEAKRRGGFTVTDPEKQLKSALDAAKTAVRNRIADMEEEIRTREKIVRERTQIEPDEELTDLRNRRDELAKLHAETFPKQPLTQEQRVNAASKSLDRAIAQLESDLKSGDVSPKPKKPSVISPELDVKRAKLEALQAQRDELRKAANPKASPEERQLAAYKRSLTKRLADLKRRVAEGDFSKKEVKHVVPDKEATDLKYQIKQEQDKFKALEDKWKKSQLKGVERAIHLAGESLNFSRAVMTSMDLSAVLRQGGVTVAGHPILAAKAFPDMLRAFASKQGEFAAMEGIRNRPNAQLYEQAKLAITASEGKLSQQEEAFFGSWAQKIPGVAGSERAYVTFLNRMRADVFDSMVATLGANGKVSIDEAKVIANFVNVATGRADFGRMGGAADALATVFFSPRYMASRFQLLLGQPLSKGNARTRKLVAKEYARSLAGIGTFFGLAAIGGFFATDKKDKPKFELDPRSVEFGKIRYGDVIVDPLAGLSQTTVLLSRLASGQTKMSTGEIVPIRGEGVPYNGLTAPDAIWRFLRGKLAPAPGAVIDAVSGENIVGEKVTPVGAVTKSLIPLSFRDIYEAMQADGMPKKAALPLLVVLGVGVQNYQNAPPERFAEKIAEHERLAGTSSKTHKPFNYSDDVKQIVAEAKKRGLTEAELRQAMIQKMRRSGMKDDAIIDRIQRLHYRFNRQ